MNRLLKLTTIIEAATGLALMAVPSVVVQLLLGGKISGASVPLGRVYSRWGWRVGRHTTPEATRPLSSAQC
jgi:hypothetical protein